MRGGHRHDHPCTSGCRMYDLCDPRIGKPRRPGLRFVENLLETREPAPMKLGFQFVVEIVCSNRFLGEPLIEDDLRNCIGESEGYKKCRAGSMDVRKLPAIVRLVFVFHVGDMSGLFSPNGDLVCWCSEDGLTARPTVFSPSDTPPVSKRSFRLAGRTHFRILVFVVQIPNWHWNVRFLRNSRQLFFCLSVSC